MVRVRLGRCMRRLEREPFEVAAGLLAIATAIYVVVAPLAASRYPMMTDMPFHAAYAAILRHHSNPAWHFDEQFALQPWSVPYLSSFVIAALVMDWVGAVTAIKVSAAIMLALLPAGLAVLSWGMKKSPLLGLAGSALVWGHLTSWGFVNFLGALGLFAMALGLALRLVDRPSRRWSAALVLALGALFCTHPFRYPYAIAALVGTALVMYPAARRLRPLVVPVVCAAVPFGIWWATRPAALAGELGVLTLAPDRLSMIGGFVYGSFHDPAEGLLVRRALGIGAALVLFIGVARALEPQSRSQPSVRWRWCAALLVGACAGAMLLSYLILPMQIGIWWYVYPREITAACYLALALMPDLPRAGVLRLAAVCAICAAVLPLSLLAARHYRGFDAATRDFTAVVDHVPRAPKLLYLVIDHQGSVAAHTPFIHLPAYVQAEKGGWLSFHFATWGASPIVYRDPSEPGAVVPPPVPLRWEWTPERFRVLEHGPFFDWFLVRERRSPAARLAADPSIELVAHEGSWWLFRRR